MVGLVWQEGNSQWLRRHCNELRLACHDSSQKLQRSFSMLFGRHLLQHFLADQKDLQPTMPNSVHKISGDDSYSNSKQMGERIKIFNICRESIELPIYNRFWATIPYCFLFFPIFQNMCKFPTPQPSNQGQRTADLQNDHNQI